MTRARGEGAWITQDRSCVNAPFGQAVGAGVNVALGADWEAVWFREESNLVGVG